MKINYDDLASREGDGEAHEVSLELECIGWGLIGDPEEGIIVSGPEGDSIDVTGYSPSDYWEGKDFIGADPYGIVPIYRAADGSQFPPGAKQYPYLA